MPMHPTRPAANDSMPPAPASAGAQRVVPLAPGAA